MFDDVWVLRVIPPYRKHLIEKIQKVLIKVMGSVKIEQPFEFVLRAVKTKGLKVNTFNGKRVAGHQISVQVEKEDIKKIQKV